MSHVKAIEQPRVNTACLAPQPNGDISWRLLHRAVSTGVYPVRFTHFRCLPFLQREGKPGTRLPAPFLAAPEPLAEVLAALLPTPVHLHTPQPWRQGVTRPCPPPPDPGESCGLEHQREDAEWGVRHDTTVGPTSIRPWSRIQAEFWAVSTGSVHSSEALSGVPIWFPCFKPLPSTPALLFIICPP